jgi:hypothetical protein
MSVKLLVLKSYEDVIADVKEMIAGEKVIGYVLSNPFITRLDDGTDDEPAKVTFYPYVPLSKQKEIPIPCDWVVSIVEPLDEVKESYLERLNAKPENSSIED